LTTKLSINNGFGVETFIVTFARW